MKIFNLLSVFHSLVLQSFAKTIKIVSLCMDSYFQMFLDNFLDLYSCDKITTT